MPNSFRPWIDVIPSMVTGFMGPKRATVVLRHMSGIQDSAPASAPDHRWTRHRLR
ncbi:hypothetical protein KFU94_33430 [Chloroflexi bacterium TSY]|nr:hypothetical protein [Chloroflexi bacterium TSY]